MADSCVNELLKAFEGLSKSEAEDLVSNMSKARRQAFMEGVQNPQSQYRQKAQSFLNEYRWQALRQKAEALENVAKRNEVKRIATMLGATEKAKAEGLEAVLVGSGKRIEGWSNSVEARQHSYRNQLLSGFGQDLRDAETRFPGIQKIAQSGALDREVRIEWEQLNLKAKGKPGVSGSKEAAEIARMLHRLENAKYGMTNAAGIYKRRLEGFAGSVSHDNVKIADAGFEAWYGDIVNRLDYEKTFGRDFFEADPKEFLKTVYDDITTGKSSKTRAMEESSDKVISLVGMPASFSRRMTRSRVLHFKDAGQQHDYHLKFGDGTSLYQQQISGIEKTGRDIGLTSIFGTNPEATYQVVKKQLGLEGTQYKWLDNRMAELTGATLRPAENPLAVASTTVRSVLGWSKMGLAAVSSFPDLAVKAAGIKAQTGDTYLGAFGKAFDGFRKGLRAEYRDEAIRYTGAGAQYMSSMMSNHSSMDSLPGALSRVNQLYYKLNGLHYMTQANMTSAGMVLSNALGDRAHLAHEALPAFAQQNLSRYKIGKPQWELMRQAMETAENGEKHLGFAAVRDLGDDVVEKTMRANGMIQDGMSERAVSRAVESFRQESATRLATYYADQSRILQLEPGARERAMLLRGTTADTPEGQAMRFVAQFKAYPFALINKALPEVGFQNGAHSWTEAISSGKGAKMQLAVMLGSLTALGYVARSAKQIIRDGSVEDPSKAETWKEAFIQGGAGGIYGDLLLGEYDSRHGRSALANVIGPTGALFNDAMDLKTKIFSDEKSRVKQAAALRFMVNNTPGSNLPYFRKAMDHLFLYNLQESLNPGFMLRAEARAKKRGNVQVIGGP